LAEHGRGPRQRRGLPPRLRAAYLRPVSSLGQQHPRRGFTVLELAVALALITLVAVLAIPAFYGRPEVTLDRAALLLARDLRIAQNEAVRWSGDVHFDFLAEGQGYAP